ncbi:prepilin, shufflon protein A [Salmonella enterica subsp. enterica]|nr:prepilin, shufflon protein A [Salmonella enterica subsp. enterica serovar Menston]
MTGESSCQSGVWAGSQLIPGHYTNLGSFTGTYSGSNATNHDETIYVYGGNPPSKKINYGDADNCVNTYSLYGTVNNLTVAKATDGNSEWDKTGFISFIVPAGNTYTITSNGMMNYGCGYGYFQVFQYQ